MKKIIIFCILISKFLLSCKEYDHKLIKIQQDDCSCIQEQAFSNKSGETVSVEMRNGRNLLYEVIDSNYVLEGDILLSKEQIDFLRKVDDEMFNSRSNSSAPGALLRRWTNSTVNFKISISHRRADILWAINHIESNTNINFIENSSGNYIDFIPSDGCSSQLGMQGGRQTINLSSGCVRGSIVHEICHALGIFHEQSRPDRNNNIIINWGNIESDRSHNFETELAHNYGTFDFGSIMMYNSFAFSSNGNPTITRLNGATYATQRNGLSKRHKCSQRYLSWA